MTALPASDHSASAFETLQVELARCQSDLSSLRQSEAAWHEIFMNAPEALSLASASDGRLREVNARYAQLMGLAAEELTGRLLSELHLLPEDSSQERIAAELAEHASVNRIANRYRRRDGTLQPSFSSLRLVAFAGETLILSSMVDAAEGSADARELLNAQSRHVSELEAEIAVHREQERRMIGEISGLCTEASLLKSDIIKLKQMQQELSGEMENLRKHAVLVASTQAAAPPPSEVISSATTARRAASTGEQPASSLLQSPSVPGRRDRRAGDYAPWPPLEERLPHSVAPPKSERPSAGEAVDAPPVVAPRVHNEPGGPRDALGELASARLQHVEEQLIKHLAALRELAVRMQAGSSSA